MTERQLKAEAYLKKYGKAVDYIRRCEREYDDELIQIDAVRSPSDNDGMPHGNGTSDPTADKAVRLLDKAERIMDAKLEAIRIRQEVFDTIMLLDGLEADVLLERYVYLSKWEDVCLSVNYSWHPVRLAWHRGLDRIKDIIDTR